MYVVQACRWASSVLLIEHNHGNLILVDFQFIERFRGDEIKTQQNLKNYIIVDTTEQCNMSMVNTPGNRSCAKKGENTFLQLQLDGTTCFQ